MDSQFEHNCDDLRLGCSGLIDLPSFIKDSLPNVSAVTGPTAVYAKYDDGPDRRATMRFATDDPEHPEVIVKLNYFPFLTSSPSAHRLVYHCAPKHVPKVLAIGEVTDGSLILLAPFDGQPIANSNDPALLLELARTLGKIQVECTQESVNEFELPTIALADFRKLFNECVANIDSHLDAWRNDDGRLKQAMGFPGDTILAKMNSLSIHLEGWIDSVSEAAIELTVEHGDCHAGNAVQLRDGTILIFDWENACRSHPFISAEKLLTSGWARDSGITGGPWGYARNTPTQEGMKLAYLAEFGQVSVAMKRSFDAAMCLGVIKEMHHEMEWARLCGWKDLNPEWTAQLVNRLLQHSLLMS